MSSEIISLNTYEIDEGGYLSYTDSNPVKILGNSVLVQLEDDPIYPDIFQDNTANVIEDSPTVVSVTPNNEVSVTPQPIIIISDTGLQGPPGSVPSVLDGGTF